MTFDRTARYFGDLVSDQVRQLVRARGPFVEQYQPETKEWIEAPWWFSAVYGDDRWDLEEVSIELAENLTGPDTTLRQLSPERIARLRELEF